MGYIDGMKWQISQIHFPTKPIADSSGKTAIVASSADGSASEFVNGDLLRAMDSGHWREVIRQSGQATNASQLDSVKSAMQDNLSQLASDPKAFRDALKKSFGDNYDAVKAETIRQDVLSGDFSWMPVIKVVDEAVLQDTSGTQKDGQALGAYSKDENTIYISKQLLASDPQRATEILTEEVGHALDAQLNSSDAAGDEGAIFSKIVCGEAISDTELAALRSENDSGVIVVDGKELEVEYGILSKIKDKLKDVVDKVKETVKDTLKSVGDSIYDAAKDYGNFYTKGLKKIAESETFNSIMTVAQFIPIPFVQVAVRVVNMARAAYSLYQGVKHGSIGAVLEGVASVASGVGNIGSMLGNSSAFFQAASSFGTMAANASVAFRTMAVGDFSEVAGFASSFFAGSGSGIGRTMTTVGKAAD